MSHSNTKIVLFKKSTLSKDKEEDSLYNMESKVKIRYECEVKLTNSLKLGLLAIFSQ